jgi:DNA-binding NarL/FixJ family response regulator
MLAGVCPAMDMQLSIAIAGSAAARAAEAAAVLRGAGFVDVRVGEGARRAPDVVVLTSDAPAAERVRAVRELSLRHPGATVVVLLEATTTPTEMRNAMREGAHGVVLEDRLGATLPGTVLAVAAGQVVAPTAMARRLAPPPLSHREKETLALVVQGLTNRQIAAQLFLAESTVKTHLSSVLRKLDARSRAEAVAIVLDPAEGHNLDVGPLPPSARKIERAQAV